MRREYPERPILGVGAVIVRGEEVVVVKRAHEPHAGEWSLPGGVLEVGETLAEAVVREAHEETGLRVRPLEVVEVVERIFRDDEHRCRFHFVIVDYLCELIDGELRAGQDAAEARWMRERELEHMELAPPAAEVIRKAMARLRDRRAS